MYRFYVQPVSTSGATLTSDNPLCTCGLTLNLCHTSWTIVKLTSLKLVSQFYTPLTILPESGCAEFTAYAEERPSKFQPSCIALCHKFNIIHSPHWKSANWRSSFSKPPPPETAGEAPSSTPFLLPSLTTSPPLPSPPLPQWGPLKFSYRSEGGAVSSPSGYSRQTVFARLWPQKKANCGHGTNLAPLSLSSYCPSRPRPYIMRWLLWLLRYKPLPLFTHYN